jgi:hypothetical protein
VDAHLALLTNPFSLCGFFIFFFSFLFFLFSCLGPTSFTRGADSPPRSLFCVRFVDGDRLLNAPVLKVGRCLRS